MLKQFRKAPWLDYGGRFSPLKAGGFLALFIPGVIVAYGYANDQLGARPLNEAIHQIGNWSLKLIFLSLAVTPARHLLQWPRLILVRRMVGVAAFGYAVAHLSLYVVDQAFDLEKVAVEIALRFYLTIGFSALVVLSAMAATSTDAMMRRLRGRGWRRLHQLIYGGALLAVLHFFMQTKASVNEPWVMTGLYAWLVGYRILAWARRSERRVPLWSIAGLSIASALFTALGEAACFWAKFGTDPALVLSANLMTTVGMRPSWVVLTITLGLLLAGQVMQQERLRLRPT
ncbi:MAG TPA: ferric reductase-like transmembrane domain-containing protein [Stellaceae bacterium]|nr:ferric reductase-like transmembrane domain-containing protein [Stellaceae bacterium]